MHKAFCKTYQIRSFRDNDRWYGVLSIGGTVVTVEEGSMPSLREKIMGLLIKEHGKEIELHWQKPELIVETVSVTGIG